MLWKMWRLTLQSMGCTNHKFPIYATQSAETQLKSIVYCLQAPFENESPFVNTTLRNEATLALCTIVLSTIEMR